MRTMSASLTAACSTPGSVFDLRLELADIWPHFATVATPVGASAGGPAAAALATDGALVAGYVGTVVPNAVYALRVTDPADPARWAGWSVLSADARAQAGLCLSVAGSVVRALWQAATSTAILYADSADSGVTWGIPATLFDPGHPCYGIAADGDLTTVLVAYDPVGLGAVRLAAWHGTGPGPGGWSGSDWTNGDQNTIVGIGAVRQAAGTYALVLALQGATGEAYSIQSCLYAPGGGPTWTPLAPIVAVDIAAGLLVRYPHLAFWGGMYRLVYGIVDTGAVSGIAYARVARSARPDFAHWQAAVEDPGRGATGFPYGAAWIAYAGGQLLVAAEVVRLARGYDPARDYRDLTADLLRLDLVERQGQPARLVVTIDNSAGAYSALPALLPNAQLLLSQGFVGAGLIPTHLLYVDQWTLARAADEAQVTLVASDRLRFLERQGRYPLGYTACSAGYIAQDLAILAGFDAAQVDASPQFATAVALFQAPPGTRYAALLARLLAPFDGAALARTIPATLGAGMVFAAREVFSLVGKGGGGVPVWAYGPEPERLHLARSGDRANHLVVYGPQGAAGAMAEVWDWGDVAATGQERFALLVEGFASGAAAAQLIAALALARETRLATVAELLVGPHPGLELLDALGVADPQAGTVVVRITGQRLSYYPLEALQELALICEGM